MAHVLTSRYIFCVPKPTHSLLSKSHQTSYLAKYPVTEEVPADDVAIYCNCGARGDEEDDGRAMIQCSNEARYCIKEWYHAECVGMEDDEMPSDDEDWFCDDCEEEGLGKLSDRV